jgi:hypothetical protein
MKHVPYWELTNIRCRCAKWSYLGNVVPKMWAPLSLWHSGAYRGVRKELRPVCQYRQHLFNCVHVVFHRSYAAVGGRNEPLLVAVLGLKGWQTIICWCYIVWYVSCLHCYCAHVTWHNGTEGLLNWCRTEQFNVPFLQGHLVRFPHALGGES